MQVTDARRAGTHAWRLGESVAVLGIMVLTFVVHAASPVTTSSDSAWTLHLAASMLQEGNLDLDEYRSLMDLSLDYRLREIDGHIYYYYPAATPLLVTPIVVLVLSRLLLGEALTGRKILGVALGFVGVVVVIFERGVSASVEHVYGNVLVFVAVLAWSLYTVYGRRLIAAYGPIESTAMILIGGTIVFLPFGILPMTEFQFSSLSTGNWLQILYLALVTSVLSYLLWYYALGRVEAGKVALFTNLQPILTTALAVLLLGQDVTVPFLLGGCIAITGVVVAQFG